MLGTHAVHLLFILVHSQSKGFQLNNIGFFFFFLLLIIEHQPNLFKNGLSSIDGAKGSMLMAKQSKQCRALSSVILGSLLTGYIRQFNWAENGV